MESLAAKLDAIAETNGFSGAVRVQRGDEAVAEFARGFADRANQRLNDLGTRFGVASGTKGLTALTIMSLVESGELSLETPVRQIVGDVLPYVDETVTVENLITHRSGVGDYIDEEALGHVDDHVLGTTSAHTFVAARNYLNLLNAHAQQSPPGEKFAYNNGGFVILGLIIEVITGSYHAAVIDRVLTPAGMSGGGFFRSDDLPANTALGYLENGRSNVFHLPVIGAGDGGSYFTLDDCFALWRALFNGQIVSTATAEQMTSIVSDNGESTSYGMGFWLDGGGDHVRLVGMDPGVSFLSGVFRSSDVTYAILANDSGGVWPLLKLIVEATAQRN